MIGMMNSGAETSVEFYASARPSSLYGDNRKRSKESRTYTPEGRILINGEPLSPQGVDEMWRTVIIKSMAHRLINNSQNTGGALAKIRRLSDKLKFRRTTSTKPKFAEEEEDIAQMSENYRELAEKNLQKDDECHPSSDQSDRYVTTIRIDSADNCIDEDTILAKLLKESKLMEKVEHVDSGKGSIDDDVDDGIMIK